MSNALKFTARGGIGLTARREGSEVQVTVSDTGSGVAAEDRERIFERFVQSGSQHMGKPPGTGLGLTICRQIVEQLGGRIWLTPAQSGGSLFIVALPVADPDLK